MRIDIITAVPQMLTGPLDTSIVKKAIDNGVAEIHIQDLRKYSTNAYRQIDDYPFGGGAGMVLMIEPIDKCISELKQQRTYDEVIYMTPDGETLKQPVANQLSLAQNLIVLCGHYKGVDQRVRDHLITREISIGDYVLSGGELGAMVLCDSIIRLLPGVLGDETSALTDSFQDGLLAPPIYTRPASYNGWEVPEILTSGHARKIDDWREQQAQERTERLRPDLLDGE